jgi:hypothetical protein
LGANNSYATEYLALGMVVQRRQVIDSCLASCL